LGVCYCCCVCFFPIGEAGLGIYVMFFIFCGFCILGLVLILVAVKETKHKTKVEIENDWYPQGKLELE